jgi:phosphoglycerate dehydrogenase-like enzyme
MSGTFRIGASPDFYTEARANLDEVVAEQLAGVADVVVVPMSGDKTAAPESLRDLDAVFALALKITPESLRGVERLAIVARWGVGYDLIDVDALTEAGVVLSITPNAVRRPVAEAILTLIFALAKNLFLQDRVARSGGWRGDLPKLGQSLVGLVLGSVGCGNIAREMFRLASPFGFGRLIACDPYVDAAQVRDLGVELTDMDTVFRESDFVAVNTFLSAETRGLVGERHFRLMKPSAYLINTARGPIVQHEALVRALRERWIAGAGIDVFPTEPPPRDDPLFELDNVIVAPHALAWTDVLMRDNGREAFQNALAVSRGRLPGGIVNRGVLDQPKFQEKLARYRRRS